MGVKVITAPTLTSVISDADLRTHLKLASDGTQDELITTYRSAAHAMAQHYTSVAIGTQVLELALDEFPDGAIELPRGKVNSITSVTYVDEDEATQTISSSNYVLDDYSTPAWVVPDSTYTWPTTFDAANVVKVRYSAGEVQDAVKSALLLMIGWMYEHRGDSMDANDIQPPAAKALLDTVKDWGR